MRCWYYQDCITREVNKMLKGFISCFIYLAAIGILSFFLGRILPKHWFHADAFPFKSFAFEKNGRIYDKILVKKWQNKVPDMSRIFPGLMREKKFSGGERDASALPLMLEETCIAETIHWLLFILGFGCIFLWRGGWGIAVAIIYDLLGNVTFIIIQRYNRPRLMACLTAAQHIKIKKSGAAV